MTPATTLILLASCLAGSASARLNGWQNDWALVRDGIDGNPYAVWKVCDGWGEFCDDSRCQYLEHFQSTPDGLEASFSMNWLRVSMRKGGAAWVDAYRLNDGSDTFEIFETNGDGKPQGQCQLDYGSSVDCKDGRKSLPKLHCWQW